MYLAFSATIGVGPNCKPLSVFRNLVFNWVKSASVNKTPIDERMDQVCEFDLGKALTCSLEPTKLHALGAGAQQLTPLLVITRCPIGIEKIV